MKKALLALLATAGLSQAAQIFTIGAGGIGNLANQNNWPAAETPNSAIDGVAGTKYLNFAHPVGNVNDYNSGYIFTPTAGAATVIGINFTTANDSVGRDPATYVLYGSNNAAAAASTTVGQVYSVDALFTQISTGALNLAAARLDSSASNNVAFANGTAYQTFLLVFPTVKDPTSNSMQIAEARLQTAGGDLDSAGVIGGGRLTVVPEPATGLFALVGAFGLAARRRRA